MHDYVNSQLFVDACMQDLPLYTAAFESDPNCLIDPSLAHYEHHVEPINARQGSYEAQRAYKWRTSSPPHDPNALYSRMDFFFGPPYNDTAGEGYKFPAHLDYPHRVLSLLLFFTDVTPETGGQLEMVALRDPEESKGARHPEDKYELLEAFYPHRGSVISHLSSHPNSWHRVQPWRGPGYRRLVQIQLSSTVSVCRVKP
eukprot:TRINITY_DN12144_c0_g1_i1.p1 TRINITY_DN12144_c0_g1~~TRINITY_DN12144_c0_g1_i1.p1  ORF type:complete len:200 (+),score=36.68 TRINITY_DN12144_c0_g1_i1:662-1261(+)